MEITQIRLLNSQIETISKARQGQIMSVDAAVDELYGDDKDDTWKQEEIKRLKEELGIGEVEEPGVNLEAGGFQGEYRRSR